MATTMHSAHGGKLGPHKPLFSEAKRRAESLFESSTVAEIREIESKTRADIDAKKNQLRQLVGDSYRDLIDSADKIVGIANNCELILQSVKEIQQGFSSLAHSFTTADSLLNEKRDSLTRHEELYAVSGRVRYLVDTPEVIWGFLDGQQYLEAAQRFLRAQLVHQQLHTNFSKSMLAKFPLLSHQWPVVLKFKQQITAAVQACLSSGARPLDPTSGALAALAVLEGLDAAAALQQLLAARKAAFRQQLQEGSVSEGVQGGPQQPAQRIEEVAKALTDAAAIIQSTVAQVGVLFLPAASATGASPAAPADHSTCHLQLMVREDEVDLSELLFGGHAALTSTGAGGAAAQSSAPELQEWHRKSKKMQDDLVALSPGVVERTVMQWVRELSEEATQHGQSMLEACTTARQLVDIEGALRGAVAGWRLSEHDTHPHRPGSGGGGALSLPSQRRPRLPTPYAAAALVGVPGTPSGLKHSLSWEGICESVMGAPVSLWQEVFYPLFMVRAKQLISEGFQVVVQQVGPQLDECLRQAAAAQPEAAGKVASGVWPDAEVAASLEEGDRPGRSAGLKQTLLPWSERLGTGGLGRKTLAGSQDKAFRSGVHAIRKQVDQQLHSVLQSALLLLGGDATGHLHSAHSRLLSQNSGQLQSQGSLPLGVLGGRAGSMALSGPLRPGSLGAGRDAIRAAELEPFVQARCVDMAGQLRALLEERLSALDIKAGLAGGATVAEQALLVGRLSSALAWESRYLPVLLGSPDAWRSAAAAEAASGGRTAATGGSGVAQRGATKVVAGSKLQSVVEQLRSIAMVAYRAWARWAATSLATSLSASLLTDDTLTLNTAPLSWQETVIPAAPATDASLDMASLDDVPMTDMRFSLPACPSAATQVLLQSACVELRRAGDHTAPAEAIQVWEWELLGASLSVFSQLLGSSTLDMTLDSPGGGVKLPGTTLSTQLTEKGVLQLLFDVRLLRDVLAGGRPLLRGDATDSTTLAVFGSVLLDPQEPEALSALSERRKAGNNLEQQLQDKLDPIDWATYETHLWSSVKKHYQRCVILYGALIQLQRVHAEGGASTRATVSAVGGATNSSALNPLGVMPVAARFPYLPIAVPTAAGLAGSLAASKARSSTPVLSKLTTSASHSDLAASYSFAELGSSSRATSNTAAAAAAASADSYASSGVGALGASATHAFGQLQARLGTSGVAFGSLGTLLGDKAAEVTAMAQQKFDFSDIGNALGSAAGGLGSGLLSSLTKGVTKK